MAAPGAITGFPSFDPGPALTAMVLVVSVVFLSCVGVVRYLLIFDRLR